MPSLGRSQQQRGGALDTFRSFVNVIREIRFDEVREMDERPPRLLVLAPLESDALAVGDMIAGVPGSAYIATGCLGAGMPGLDAYDAIIVFHPDGPAAAEQACTALVASGVPVVVFESSDPLSEVATARARQAITERHPERSPALGRYIPAFRAAAVKAIIDETAKANAQFALLANLPTVIPILGALTSVGADMVVLTKNQLMMIFKIAAAHGRDLHDHWGIVRELIPVVGAGFFWRTVAREAASFLPLAAGTIPKVVIAYTGTVAAGRAADFYYRMGRRPSREQLRDYCRQAASAVKKLPLPLPGGSPDGRP